jgi:hypothetical protein
MRSQQLQWYLEHSAVIVMHQAAYQCVCLSLVGLVIYLLSHQHQHALQRLELALSQRRTLGPGLVDRANSSQYAPSFHLPSHR